MWATGLHSAIKVPKKYQTMLCGLWKVQLASLSEQKRVSSSSPLPGTQFPSKTMWSSTLSYCSKSLSQQGSLLANLLTPLLECAGLSRRLSWRRKIYQPKGGRRSLCTEYSTISNERQKPQSHCFNEGKWTQGTRTGICKRRTMILWSGAHYSTIVEGITATTPRS